MLAKLIIFAITFCVGVSVGSLVTVNLAVISLVFFLSLVFSLTYYRRTSPTYLFICLLLISFGLGLLRVEVASWQFGNSELEASLNSEVSLEGIVTKEPDYREKTVQLYVKTSEDLLLVTADRLTEVSYGDVVTFSGQLTRPESFETDLGRTFDYPRYLQAKGVEYRVSFASVEVVEEGGGNPFVAYLLKLKSWFISSIEKLINEPEVGLGKGLLLGVQSALGEDIEENFRRTGIIHIVVLSGYNVMLVVAFILFCFSFFLSLRWRVVAGIAAIIAFALIVGLSATVVRASIMAGLVLFAQAFGRQYDVLRALIFAGLIMIIINPYLLLFDIGFQLSFMATLGLILLVPQFETSIIKNEKLFQAREFMLATISTQIAVLPLLLFHIGEVSLVAIIVNVLILPVVPFAMLLTFLAGVLSLVSPTIAAGVGFLASITLSYIIYVATIFGNLPIASVRVPEFSAYGVGLLYLFIGAIFYYLKVRPRETKDPMSDWVIEEETETADLSLSHKATDKSADDIPVFFR